MAVRYLLDTHICLYIAKHKPPAVRARFEQLSAAVGQHYGEIRSSLARVGQSIGHNDLWIAAHARAKGWVLVTNNERQFRCIDGFTVENSV